MEVTELLRARPPEGPFPEFDVERVPPTPGELFLRWLECAVRAGVRVPQAMTLSTADSRGRPSSRMMLLRDLDVAGAGWVFATSSASRKGRELALNPWAALSSYWAEQARQVRVSGRVEAAPTEVSAQEFRRRAEGGRLSALTGQQSAPLSGLGEFDAAAERARALLERHPEAVAPHYTRYTLRAEEVEFWQGDAGWRHVRLRYALSGGRWERQLLWP